MSTSSPKADGRSQEAGAQRGHLLPGGVLDGWGLVCDLRDNLGIYVYLLKVVLHFQSLFFFFNSFASRELSNQ